MDTFSPNNRPTTELTLTDQSGVGLVIARFSHVEANSYMVLQGDGNGETQAVVILQLSSWSQPLAAGEYQCQRVEASDVAGNIRTYTPDTHPQLADKSFRYEYPAGQSGDEEGPELIG